jgi:hypothetical protein
MRKPRGLNEMPAPSPPPIYPHCLHGVSVPRTRSESVNPSCISGGRQWTVVRGRQRACAGMAPADRRFDTGGRRPFRGSHACHTGSGRSHRSSGRIPSGIEPVSISPSWRPGTDDYSSACSQPATDRACFPRGSGVFPARVGSQVWVQAMVGLKAFRLLIVRLADRGTFSIIWVTRAMRDGGRHG